MQLMSYISIEIVEPHNVLVYYYTHLNFEYL